MKIEFEPGIRSTRRLHKQLQITMYKGRQSLQVYTNEVIIIRPI